MTPTPKVAAGGIASVLAVFIVGLFASFGVILDPTVAVALAGLFSFGISWLKREKGIDLGDSGV